LLVHGRIYRTAEFTTWTSNPSRLVDALEEKGILRRLAHGLFMMVERTKFGGFRRAQDDDLLRAFLGDDNFVVTGSDAWNALGLGAKAVLTAPFVYNHHRSGEATVDGRRFLFRRCKFPKMASPEWYVIDLLENHCAAQLGLDEAEDSLTTALVRRRFDPERLASSAIDYGSAVTLRLVLKALTAAGLLDKTGWTNTHNEEKTGGGGQK
jgi:hypothetical protein